MPRRSTSDFATLICIVIFTTPYFISLNGMLSTTQFYDPCSVSERLCEEINKTVIDVKKIEDLLNEVRFWDNLKVGRAKRYLAQPLKAAVHTKNLQILKSLILAGGDVNKGGLLHAAIRFKNPAAIDYLVAHGADINQNKLLQGTPLHEAVSLTIDIDSKYKYDTATMLTLLKHRPNTSAPDLHVNDETALYQATSNKNLEAMQLLLAHGARHTDKNYFGNTPLMALKDNFNALIQDPDHPEYWSRVCNQFVNPNGIPDNPIIGMHHVENAAFMLLAYGANPDKSLSGKPHPNSTLDTAYLKIMFDTTRHADRVIAGQEEPHINHLEAGHQWLFIWRLLSAGKEDVVHNLNLPRRVLEIEIMKNWFTSFPCPHRFYDENSRMTEQNLFRTIIHMQPLNEFKELKHKFVNNYGGLSGEGKGFGLFD